MRSHGRSKERRVTIVLAVILVAVVALVVAKKKFLEDARPVDSSSLFESEGTSSLEAIFAEDIVVEEPAPEPVSVVQPAAAESAPVVAQVTPAEPVDAAPVVPKEDAEKAKGVPSGGVVETELEVSVGGDNEVPDEAGDEANEDLLPDDVVDTDTPVEDVTPLPVEDEVVEPVLEVKGPKTYVVQSGDSLSTIAEKFYGRSSKWQLIMSANGIKDPHMLRIGMELVIPDENAPLPKKKADMPEKKKVQEGEEGGTAPGQKNNSYIVKRNDSLWKIAASVYGDGTKWREVFEANRDKLRNKDALRVGQVLRLP